MRWLVSLPFVFAACAGGTQAPEAGNCDDLTFSEDEIRAAVRAAAREMGDLGYVIDSRIWQQPERLDLLLRTAARHLECDPDSGARREGWRTGTNCDIEVCGDSTFEADGRYCSIGARRADCLNPLIVDDVGDCLNRVCFQHDVCYARGDIDIECVWSPATDLCDQQFFAGGAECFLEGRCLTKCLLTIATAKLLSDERHVSEYDGLLHTAGNVVAMLHCPRVVDGECPGDESTNCPSSENSCERRPDFSRCCPSTQTCSPDGDCLMCAKGYSWNLGTGTCCDVTGTLCCPLERPLACAEAGCCSVGEVFCGDGFCDPELGERDDSCEADCHCGDGVCDVRWGEGFWCRDCEESSCCRDRNGNPGEDGVACGGDGVCCCAAGMACRGTDDDWVCASAE